MEIHVNLVRNDPKAPSPLIPIFWLGEGRTPLPQLNRDRAIALARIILADEAKRGVPRGRHSKEHIRSEFISYQGTCPWRRGSDLVERVYAAVEILKRGGLTDKDACLEVAEMIGPRLGNSRRGRPRCAETQKDALDSAANVRGLHNDFRDRRPWKEKLPAHDPVVERWFAYALGISAWSEAMISSKTKLLTKNPTVERFLLSAKRFAPWSEKLHGLTVRVRVKHAIKSILGKDLFRIPKLWWPTSVLKFEEDHQPEPR